MLQILLVCLVCVPKTLQMGHYPNWRNSWNYHGSTKSNEGLYNPRQLHPTRGEIFGSKYHPATPYSPMKRLGGDSHYHSGKVQMNQPLSKTTKCLLNLYSKPSMTGRSSEYSTSSAHPVNYPSTRKSNRDYFTPTYYQGARNNILNSHHYGQFESVLPAQTDCSLPYFPGTGLFGKDVAFRIGSPADYTYDDFESRNYCKRSYCGPCAYVDQSSLGSYPSIQNTYTNPPLLSQFYSEPNENFSTIDPFRPTYLLKRLLQDVLYCNASQPEDKSHDSDHMHQKENDRKQLKPDLTACFSDFSNDVDIKTVNCLCKCLKDKDCRHHESHRQSDDISAESKSNHNDSDNKNSEENSDKCEASLGGLFKEPQVKGFMPEKDCATSETEPPTTIEELKTTTEYPSEMESATTTEEPYTTTEYPSETEAAEYLSETEAAASAEKHDNTSDSEHPSKSSELADDASNYSKSSSYSSSSSYSYSSSGAR